jgi:ATP-dependent protease Clp ATPase subunit
VFAEPKALADIPTPQQIVAKMDETVAGIIDIKKRLAWVLYRHMVGAFTHSDDRPPNILLMGNSGVGKTFVINKLLEACPVIWTEATITEFSDVGFQGRDLPGMYLGLFGTKWRKKPPKPEVCNSCGTAKPEDKTSKKEMIALAENWGVVVLDEIDKIRTTALSPAEDRQQSKYMAMQAELLKLSEGAEVEVPTGKNNVEDFRTHNVLHIACGAFAGLKAQMAKEGNLDPANTPPNLHENVTVGQMVRYGFKEELIGRFSTLVPLPDLTMDHLVRILREQLVPSYERQLGAMGLSLKIDPGAMSAISSECLSSDIGARAIEPKLERIIWQSGYEGRPGDTLYIDVKAVEQNHAHLIRGS